MLLRSVLRAVIMWGGLSLALRSVRTRPTRAGLALLSSTTSSSTTTIPASAPSSPSSAFETVTLLKGKARLFQDGNPLVYGGAVGEVKGDPAAGDEVLVKDNMGNVIGRGLFNPYSQYRVRMLCRGFEAVHALPLRELLVARMLQAMALRRSLGLPSKDTTVYRLVNGEGDRLGGLIVDVFDSVVVIQSSAYWVERHRDTIESAITEAFAQADGSSSSSSSSSLIVKKKKKAAVVRLIWRRAESRLKQDGYTGKTSDDEVEGAASATLAIKENKCLFNASPDEGQKTGFYCDQRSNRLMIRGLAKGKTVLDAYCYTGGFAINAAMGGATAVMGVDSSQPALDAARDNLQLNLEAGTVPSAEAVSFAKGDCVDVMKRLADEGRQFDIVICDPPKLAPSRKDLERARNKYLKINTLALALVAPGGVLLTCTCSAAMTQTEGEFLGVLADAARLTRREVTVLSRSGAAGDHPVNLHYREGEYLTAILLHVA